MVIKPVGQSGLSSGIQEVDAVAKASGEAQAIVGVAAADAAARTAVTQAVEQAGAQVRAGQVTLTDGVAQVISAMARQQVPSGLDGAAADARYRELEQVFADDPLVAAAAERLVRAAAS